MSRGPAADARTRAFRLLRKVAGGEYADRAAAAEFSGLAGRERALAQELAYGVLRLRNRLDGELAGLVDRPLSAVDPAVLDWLRLGLYQLRELRVPDHAALHETVEGVRRTEGEAATGFVNAVLRAAARDGGGGPAAAPPEADPLDRLVRHGSHPEWLVRRWLDRWPAETVERLVEQDNRAPPVTGRLLEGSLDAARERLAAAGVEVEPVPGWPRCFRVVEGEPGRVVETVPAAIQDPAASAVVDYVGEVRRGPLVDLCAGPGTKSMGLAAAAPPGTLHVAGDVAPERLRPLRRAADRWGYGVRLAASDARRPAYRRAGTAVADVPCTGTGTLRRRPDARWRQGPERLSGLARLQAAVLDSAADLVEPAGLLVYATCSLEAEENEEQVESFLDRRPEFRREPPAAEVRSRLPEETITDRGDLWVRPWVHGTDGAYAARLRREGGG